MSRRVLIQSGVVAGVVGVVGSLSEAAVGASLAPLATTVGSTYVRGAAGPGGYRRIVRGPAAVRVVRTELGVVAAPDRAECRTPMIAFAQLTDVHVVDHQSPMRVEWTDRYDDTGASDAPAVGLFSSAHRAHEALSAHVADAMVQAINDIAVGPVTGLPLNFSMQTGDNSDNSQFNEIRWNIDLLDGEPVTSDSGDPRRYEGVQDSDPLTYDPHYYHPEGTPLGKVDDDLRANHGFPEIPGFFAAARRGFAAAGLNHEWYSAFGNHDGLVQGNFPARTVPLALLATGPLKIISPPAGISQSNVLDALTGADPNILLDSLVVGPDVKLVTADPDRRPLSRAEVVEQHFNTSGLPVGHGFTADNRAAGTAYYSFVKGDFCFVVMDTVNPNGYSDGSLDQAQFDWVKKTIATNDDKAVVLFSHHTSETMANPLVVTGGDPSPRVTGDALVAFLHTQEHVIAWINGHTHRNQIWARPGGAGGFWEINTASHIDFPQQARLVEFANNGDGTISIFTTMVDHAGPADHGGDLSTTLALASLSRELAANDPQEQTSGREGADQDRNTELLVRTPRALSAVECVNGPVVQPVPVPAGGPRSGKGHTGPKKSKPDPVVPAARGAAAVGASGVLPDTGMPDGLAQLGAAGLTAVMAGETLVRASRKGAD